MRFLLIPVFLMTFISIVAAQNAGDALRYTRIQNYGTARMAGVGNAFTGLGADFGAVSQNPAGLALFNSNEFMFTPTVNYASTDAGIGANGTTYSDESTKFRFSNLGMVFNSKPGGDSKWRNFNVGLGYNQLANYNQSIYYKGSAEGTILNGWYDEAEAYLSGGGDPENLYPLGAGLAYNAGAIYYLNDVPSYDFIDNPSAVVDRTHSVETSGRTNEMALSFAGNYAGKLLIGGTIGVPLVTYRQESTYTETDPGGGYDGNVFYFDNLAYTDYLRTNGVGVNAKLGATFILNKMIRIGGAFHTPTFYNMTDNFNSTLEYTYEDQNATGGGLTKYSDDADASAEPFNYGLRTPWKTMFGGAFIIPKYGFISADAEWTDYSASHFNLTRSVNDEANRAYGQELNSAIQRNYKTAVSYRFGAEAVLDIFRIRGGYNLLGKAAKNADGFNTAWSIGGGVRFDKAYIDLAFRRSDSVGSVSPYSGAPTASTESKVNDIMMTVGFKF